MLLHCDRAIARLVDSLPKPNFRQPLKDLLLPHLQLLNNEQLCLSPESLLQLLAT